MDLLVDIHRSVSNDICKCLGLEIRNVPLVKRNKTLSKGDLMVSLSGLEKLTRTAAATCGKTSEDDKKTDIDKVGKCSNGSISKAVHKSTINHRIVVNEFQNKKGV